MKFQAIGIASLSAAIVVAVASAQSLPSGPMDPAKAPPAIHGMPGTDDGDDLFSLAGDEGMPPGPGNPRYARDGRGPEEHGMGLLHGFGLGEGPLGGMRWRELGLTDAQRDKLMEIRDRQARAGIRARADLALARLDLMKMMRAEHPDRGAIDSQIERLGHMRTELRKSQVNAMLDARGVLTADQRRKLESSREERRPPEPSKRPGAR
jgi:Spy/CpxP family protein refolding chaperone